MYVDSSSVTVGVKTYTRHLLRASYREHGKVRHRTIANISSCSDEEIQAIKLALRHKKNLASLCSLTEDLALRQGLSVGAVCLLHSLAKEFHVRQALGSSRDGKLALWQVMARIIDQGSRLSAVRLASSHAACDIVGLDAFNEDDLYANLDWLSDNQNKIEDRLFRSTYRQDLPSLFLYDVTSSYFEGTDNDLSAFGYNRDGKRGKKQIVVGLLCDEQGGPVSVEVFRGNTQDTQTFASQVRKAAERFGGGELTFVGDRGMIKGPQIEDLRNEQFHYITALTKPQIRSLLKEGILQMSLFDEMVAEVITHDKPRYVVRRNPKRAIEVAASRQDKLLSLKEAVRKYNQYLLKHPRASVEVGARKMKTKAERMAVSAWTKIKSSDRSLSAQVDQSELSEVAKLDGCYALTTDLSQELASKETVHDRYKDLAKVELAFRTSKTGHLEMRPIHVRREKRTRGHAFVVMLAYLITRELRQRWTELNLKVEEGIKLLTEICAHEVIIEGKALLRSIPAPREELQQLLDAAQVTLPEAIPHSGVKVSTRKKLQDQRVKR